LDVRRIAEAGKQLLAKIISGEIKNFEGKLKSILMKIQNCQKKFLLSNWFQFSNLEGDRNFYYQQRYNQLLKTIH
jgi:molybdate transport system ATP-binding protein